MKRSLAHRHRARQYKLSITRSALFIFGFGCIGVCLLARSLAVTPNIVVDYTQPETAVDPLAIGIDETGYQTPNVLATDTTEVQRFKSLGTAYMRMDLKYTTSGDPGSKIICGGGGCDTGPAGDQWIGSIKQAGAIPAVITKTDTPSDGAGLVRHFNINPATGKPDATLPNYVKYWIIGNEPDLNGYSSTVYANDFNADYDAMKAVDPNIKIGGPTKAWFDATWISQFLQISASRVDFMDFHGYPSNPAYTYSDFFNWAKGTGSDVANTRSLLNQYAPARSAQIPIEVGEWSLDSGTLYASYGPNSRDLSKSNFNVVWGADVIGQIIKNGGISMHYGTKGNVIAWTAGNRTDYDTGQSVSMNLDDPMAPYHAYGMWTGEGLFRGFGNKLASATTTLANVDVFASDASKNVIVINKDASTAQTGIFSMSGIASGTVDVWQKSQSMLFNAPPEKVGSVTLVNGSFTYKLPPLSATNFVVNPSTAGGIPGDCDGDGLVTITDLSILLSHYNAAYPPCDFNGDSVIDILDLSILLSHYGL